MMLTSHAICTSCGKLVNHGSMVCQLCGEALLRTTVADIEPPRATRLVTVNPWKVVLRLADRQIDYLKAA